MLRFQSRPIDTYENHATRVLEIDRAYRGSDTSTPVRDESRIR